MSGPNPAPEAATDPETAPRHRYDADAAGRYDDLHVAEGDEQDFAPRPLTAATDDLGVRSALDAGSGAARRRPAIGRGDRTARCAARPARTPPPMTAAPPPDPPPDPALARLAAQLRAAAVLASCGDALSWDEQTYLPPAAAGHRAEQLAALAGLAHQARTAPALGAALDAARDAVAGLPPDSAEAACVREARKDYARRTLLPRRLVEEQSRVTTLAQRAWTEARADADFPAFAPHLAAVVALKREEAQAVRDGLPHLAGRPLYDALLDDYEPGADSAAVAAVFARLRDGLVPLVRAIAESGARPDRSLTRRDFPVKDQARFAREAAAALGFDFDRGRLDVAAHPFCTTLGPADCRLTTRYDRHDFSQAFFGTLHEAGHGIYEQNLPAAAYGTPPGEACGLGIHESQSRLWENFVGRSRPYWEHLLPGLKAAFPGLLDDVAVDGWYAAVNDVRPSTIRVEADEATYNLHVALRFELEPALIAGDLPAADVADAWDAGFERLFAFRPPSAAEGCLQDIHWAAGLIGYFPTYALGNVYAAMLWDAAKRDLGDLDGQLAAGAFRPLRGWLTEHVHRHGRRYSPSGLIERATGAAPDPAPLLDHLRAKYGALYGLDGAA